MAGPADRFESLYLLVIGPCDFHIFDGKISEIFQKYEEVIQY